MIRGRAEADTSLPDVPLAARPQIVHVLSRATLAVGGAGVAAALLLGVGGNMMSAAGQAAVGAGGGYSSGRPDDATVSELAATDAVGAVTNTAAGVTAGATTLGTGAAGTATAELASRTMPATGQALEVTGEVAEGPGELRGIVAPPTTEPEPTTTTSTTAPQAAAAPDPGSVEAIIMEVFGAYGEQAIGVARCESGLNPGAISRGGGNWGLFQINTVHRERVARMGYQWEDLLEPKVNSLVAWSIFKEQGWSPWGCRHAAN